MTKKKVIVVIFIPRKCFDHTGVHRGFIREIKIEVFRHFPQTANVKKSRDQVPAVRVAVFEVRVWT